MNEAPDLTLVVPCFNESQSIERCLDAIGAWRQAQDFETELIVVDDGSTDDTRAKARAYPDVRVTGVDVTGALRNRGKGSALRNGVESGTGRRLVFLDADLSVQPDQIGGLLEALDAGADVAVGCRTIPGASIDGPQPMRRRWLGRMYLKLSRWFLGLAPRDVTCGFKGFTRESAHLLFGLSCTKRWGIDAEVLFIATRHGMDMREVPVRWVDGGTSRVRLWRDVPASLISLLATRLRFRWVRPRSDRT